MYFMVIQIFRAYNKFNEAQIASFKAVLEELYHWIKAIIISLWLRKGLQEIKTGGGADQKVSLDEWIAIAEKHFISKKFAEAPGIILFPLIVMFTLDSTYNNSLISLV